MKSKTEILKLWYNYGMIYGNRDPDIYSFHCRPIFRKGINEMPQIIPIKDLKNTSEISDMCHKSDEPIYITKNGYGDMVIMSMGVYENTMRRLAMYGDLEMSEQQIEAGHVKDARTALAGMRKKYGI